MDDNLKTRLLEKLNQIDITKLANFNVVIMPDFFVDHFLTLNSFEEEFSRIQDICNQGGGNVPGIPQKIHHGGNAANTALALARLGIKSHLICRTDNFGLHLLQFFLGKSGVDLSGVKTDGKLAITTAMEFGEKHINVLVGDTGSVSNFTFENLDENDLQTVSNSDIACVVNRKQDIPELTKNVLSNGNLDMLGLNENELLHYSGSITPNNDEDVINAAISFKKKIHARVDLHTASFACTISGKYTVIPTIQLSRIYRVTGAGDTWNAGNLFAELLGFSDDERLLFANTVAGCYISSPEPIHPNLGRIVSFLNETK
jgi:sugar/nucleoside kinase (ribokinase family)